MTCARSEMLYARTSFTAFGGTSIWFTARETAAQPTMLEDTATMRNWLCRSRPNRTFSLAVWQNLYRNDYKAITAFVHMIICGLRLIICKYFPAVSPIRLNLRHFSGIYARFEESYEAETIYFVVGHCPPPLFATPLRGRLRNCCPTSISAPGGPKCSVVFEHFTSLSKVLR